MVPRLLLCVCLACIGCTSSQRPVIEISDPKDDFLTSIAQVSPQFSVSIEEGGRVMERMLLFTNHILGVQPQYTYEKGGRNPITFITFSSKNFSYTITQFLKDESFKFQVSCRGESLKASQNERVVSHFLQTGRIEETILVQ